MSQEVNRRNFLKTSLLATTGAGLALSFEEQALMGQPATASTSVAISQGSMPTGKIGNLQVSRIICGGNLISGFAHSRDLIYVSELLKNYFTDEKIYETLQKCEERGVNTAILRLDDKTLKLINHYWRQRGGKIQWIAQCKLPSNDWKSDIMRAIDNGAEAVFLHGGVAEDLVEKGEIDTLAKAIALGQENGVPTGIAGHRLDVPIAVEKADIEADFYMKTLNAKNYWSAGPMPRHDSVWAETPEKTIEFMETVKKPWIAYKVLGAGAILPKDGFKYAFENGADFLCVGMFDFQIDEDVVVAQNILSGELKRNRAWQA